MGAQTAGHWAGQQLMRERGQMEMTAWSEAASPAWRPGRQAQVRALRCPPFLAGSWREQVKGNACRPGAKGASIWRPSRWTSCRWPE